MPRIQLKIRIDSDLMRSLWELIRRKHERTYGALQEEVSHAIAHWINEHGVAVNITRKNPELPRRHNIAQEIIFAAKAEGFLTQISTSDLRRIISKVRGIDERTVRTWHRFLLQNHYLKQLSTQIYEIL